MDESPKTMSDNLDRIESIILECQKDFRQNIDAALDGYNEKWLSKKEMEQLVTLSQNNLKEIEENLADIKQMRKEIDLL